MQVFQALGAHPLTHQALQDTGHLRQFGIK